MIQKCVSHRVCEAAHSVTATSKPSATQCVSIGLRFHIAQRKITRVITQLMKRVCKRPIQIDALTLCYEVVSIEYYDRLCGLDYGEWLDMDEFRLYRTKGRYFENVYVMMLRNGTHGVGWGHLKFNLARGD